MRLLVLVVLALTAAAPGGWRTFRTDGVSVRYPPGWFATAQPLTPVTYPRQILAVASFPLPSGSAGAVGCGPREALDRMPPSGAFIFGWGYGRLSPGSGLRSRDFPPRPRHFELTGLGRYECLGLSYVVRFRAAGRAFQIHIALGRRASAATRATALRILDSFGAWRT